MAKRRYRSKCSRLSRRACRKNRRGRCCTLTKHKRRKRHCRTKRNRRKVRRTRQGSRRRRR